MDRGRKPVRINVADIVSVSACADLTLPSGASLCIETIHGPTFLVCACRFIITFHLFILYMLFSSVEMCSVLDVDHTSKFSCLSKKNDWILLN
jgi:hypothetical protein